MAQDCLEDRVHKAGKHPEFVAALRKYRAKPGRRAESILYDELTALGAGSEEASEYVDIERGNL